MVPVFVGRAAGQHAGASGLRVHGRTASSARATRARARSCGRRKPLAPNFEFSPTMKALEPFRDQINVFSGLAQVNGRALGDGPGDHARATATFLTGVHPYKTGGANFKLGISADQIAAKELGKYTQLASLEFGLEPQPLAGIATPATPAPTCRCRGGRRPSRCPLKPIRARRSSGCLATAKARTRLSDGAARRRQERAGLRHRHAVAAAGSSGHHGQTQARGVHGVRAGHRAPDSTAPRNRTRRHSCRSWTAPARFLHDYGQYARAHDRLDGGGVAVGHDPRRLVHARAATAATGPIPRSASRMATTRSRITRAIRRSSKSSSRSTRCT